MSEKAKKPVSEMNEVELYFAIDACGAFIWHMNHEISHGRIEKEHIAAIDADIERMRQYQMEAIKQLPRIGIAVPLNEQSGTPEYWTWYKTWSAWHKDKLTHEQWRELERCMVREGGLTEWECIQCKCKAFDLPLPEKV